MNGKLDGCLIVSCCDDSTDGLVKEIVDSPSVSPVDVSQGVQAFPWAFETKYYTATIYLHTTSTSVDEYDDSAENIHGLIVLFNPNQKDTLELADKWIEKCHCDVVLLVCGRCPSAAEPQDATGVRRIIEALHAHPWPQLEMKGEVPGPSRSGNQHSRLSAGDGGEASADLKLFSEAMATDGEDASFEELFAKFKDMKVQADKLSGEERKKFAEKVAIQFWRAFGGEEDEICGLSSEDEAEK
ncbi:alpha- and gamma-adaptin-binding protein p34-like isoform X2 [Dermacentor andersoni]|uniref:alpha- and gamma-adaptin-binding protein p34-like isoform X2 n=1 Tax=Dermacentor andersoni TaxID=34620 RepID=UPI0024180594|nr:alpha- and gamma-adaptin-binding protein p34-like isoform X2 [Dermacentor andersoni]